ncbi:MAG TPA: ergothioneine biosynthesis protein EgtB, partial [Gammaproteobacteria bacterium]|nr:ergothioneine biosynthesis protein EgtB [Gammaproteobacteria bacterium]
YVGFNEQYKYLFNSYYDGVGERYPRSARGNLSRPTVAEVMEYRSYVDQKMEEILLAGPSEEIERLVILGLEHEKQHQELILTDLKFNLGHNPLRPAYRNNLIPPQSDCSES